MPRKQGRTTWSGVSFGVQGGKGWVTEGVVNDGLRDCGGHYCGDVDNCSLDGGEYEGKPLCDLVEAAGAQAGEFDAGDRAHEG